MSSYPHDDPQAVRERPDLYGLPAGAAAVWSVDRSHHVGGGWGSNSQADTRTDGEAPEGTGSS